jgi:hypothetical protein
MIPTSAIDNDFEEVKQFQVYFVTLELRHVYFPNIIIDNMPRKESFCGVKYELNT